MKKILVCLAAAILVAPPVKAQMLVPMTPGQIMGTQVVHVIAALAAIIGELARANREIEEELTAARRTYFDTPPGPAREEPARSFEKAMMNRDLHFVVARIISTSRNEAPLLALANGVAGSDEVDGGVSPYVSESFGKWADVVINAAALHEPLDKALQYAMPQFEKYRAERDIAEELFHNPRSVLRAGDAKPSEYLAAWILGTRNADSFETANAAAAKIEGAVGPQRLAEIVRIVRSWSVVDNHIHTVSGWNPGNALDALVAGSPGAPPIFDTTAHRTQFLEFRSSLASWNEKLVPQLDEIERLWNDGRGTKDASAFRLAVSKRNELVAMIGATKPVKATENKRTGKLLQSQLMNAFAFLDRAVQFAEFYAMRSGQMYSIESANTQANQQAAAASQGARRGASSPAPATTGSPIASPVATPPSSTGSAAADPSVKDDDSPFDRAVTVVQNPGFEDPSARSRVLRMAKSWEYVTGSGMPPEVKASTYKETKTGIENEIVRQQDQLDRNAQSLAKMTPERRASIEKKMARGIELRKELIAELRAAIPQVEKAIAALKP